MTSKQFRAVEQKKFDINDWGLAEIPITPTKHFPNAFKQPRVIKDTQLMSSDNARR